ncbi:MAG: hypothetical protein IV104_04525 [Acidovorax sp.]|nr:hypothetical protein [Acidovorax sp.]
MRPRCGAAWDAAAQEQALCEGANPNLLAGNGSSVFMLAAHRRQMAHGELPLRVGTQPESR